ncbi:M48 family metallopeptidase [Endomicrobium proavitum]|uniref:Putative cytoplasmic membrane protease n=1 Tax=Endomicrobium proavitum TaxID=1408281 RepID=A0A0G3WHX0_9BACT|nr:M48 family metallopeptidase [Endomicrobium proavitum]AKL97447.1 putative cytoplasmic membrane protease [Endomicrobium proavitum]
MNIYMLLIVSFIFLIYVLQSVADILNVRNISAKIPKEFTGYFNKDSYAKSQKYLKTKTKFSLLQASFFTVVEIVFIFAGGFNFADLLARSFGFGEIVTGLIFFGLLFFALEILKIPFGAYDTFVIEEKFGFNKTKAVTFIADLIKNWVISAVILGAIFIVVLWFFTEFGKFAWIYSFAAVAVIEMFFAFVYPVVIMPLFNKFTPLKNGKLKTSVEKYAAKENFKMKGLFTMDNSKRSTKSNAFFTGFGRFRRIVLFDTLIKKHTVEELTSVLAHEMGHFKLGHIKKDLIYGFISMAFMFFLLSVFINSPWLFEAFKMQTASVYAGVVFFGFLYIPISFIIGIISSAISRKHEYEADAYAVKTYKKPKAMIDALKKLSVDNLSNLYPHKFKVFLEYSHPPTLERIEAIKKIKITEKK